MNTRGMELFETTCDSERPSTIKDEVCHQHEMVVQLNERLAVICNELGCEPSVANINGDGDTLLNALKGNGEFLENCLTNICRIEMLLGMKR